ncbi:unnamed protein product [Fraxinus pennsylvanica]|uniref:Uncharacterized protein n=1 Tax=Fraxinus pennsylvanica TaxID=56036 RepID=A0AAD2ABM0_9LAMI|nr:unnamed protein product [Fraxinus pennsylvanica]
MDKKRNLKLHDKHQKHHHAPDAYELYEAEHTALWLKDAHPRPSAHVNSNQFEEMSPMDENRIVVQKRNQKLHDKHHQPSDAYEVYEAEHMSRWLKDAHPPPIARANSNQFEEIRPKAENRITVDYWSTNEDSTDGNRVNYDEVIDAEAEKFIVMEHEKHGLRKWMPMKGY